MLILRHWDCTDLLKNILYHFSFFVLIVFHVGSPFVAGYGYNSLGFAQSNPYKRRVSTLDRKYASGTNRAHWNKLMTISSSVSRMQHLDTTMASLANLTAAPPAALYNPLDHGRSLAKEVRKLSYFVRICQNWLLGRSIKQRDLNCISRSIKPLSKSFKHFSVKSLRSFMWRKKVLMVLYWLKSCNIQRVKFTFHHFSEFKFATEDKVILKKVKSSQSGKS